MTREEICDLIRRSTFADLGFLEDGWPEIRRVFCTWHRGVGGHLISTNTSSRHVRALMADDRACLYFADSERFEGICLKGRAVVHFDRRFRELLWHPQDVMYYPKGVEDEDYCVIEFIAESARYYRFDGKGDLGRAELEDWDRDAAFEDCSGH